ncbi:MAG: hypothetical protein GXO15_02305, partial [Crenarchaeota archaeon]|nr:hypothetical protein [Thermoproteota archaeon]
MLPRLVEYSIRLPHGEVVGLAAAPGGVAVLPLGRPAPGGWAGGWEPLQPLPPLPPLHSHRRLYIALHIDGVEAVYYVDTRQLATAPPGPAAEPLERQPPQPPTPQDWWQTSTRQRTTYTLPFNMDEKVPTRAAEFTVPGGGRVRRCVDVRLLDSTRSVTVVAWLIPAGDGGASVDARVQLCGDGGCTVLAEARQLRVEPGDPVALVGYRYLSRGLGHGAARLCVEAAAWGGPVKVVIRGVGEAYAVFSSPFSPDQREFTYYTRLSVASSWCYNTGPCFDAAYMPLGVLNVYLVPATTIVERPLTLSVRVYSEPQPPWEARTPSRPVSVYMGDALLCRGYTRTENLGVMVRQVFSCRRTLPPWSSYGFVSRYLASGEALPLRVVVEGAEPWERWFLDTASTWVSYTAVVRSYIDGLPSLRGAYEAEDQVYELEQFTVAYDGFHGGEAHVKLFAMRPYTGRRGILRLWLDVSGMVEGAYEARLELRVEGDAPLRVALAAARSPGVEAVKKYGSYLSYALTFIGLVLESGFGGSAVAKQLATALDVMENPIVYLMTGGLDASCSQEAPAAVACTATVRAGLLSSPLRSAGLDVYLEPTS